jgi:hypothetical protein
VTDTLHVINEMRTGDTICLDSKVYTKVNSESGCCERCYFTDKFCIGVNCMKEGSNIEVVNDSSN